MKPIRIGIVGLGGICRQRHVPGLRAIEGVEIVAVANRDRASGEKAARELHIPDVHDHWRELITREDIDAIVVGTWPYLHCPVTLAALDAGKHVFCQARMAMNLAEAKTMRAKARQAGRVAMLCPVPIGMDVDRTIARLLRENTLGGLRLVRVESLSNAFADPRTPMHWRKDRRLSGLNVHTLGMYVEVMHRWFGATQSLMADTDLVIPERPGPDGDLWSVEIPDQALVNARMQAGFPIQYAFSTVAHHGKDSVEMYAENMTVHYEPISAALYAGKPGEAMQPMDIRPEDVYDLKHWDVEKVFIDAIREGAAYRPNFDDGLLYMAVTQAVHDSAREGRRIDIPTLLEE